MSPPTIPQSHRAPRKFTILPRLAVLGPNLSQRDPTTNGSDYKTYIPPPEANLYLEMSQNNSNEAFVTVNQAAPVTSPCIKHFAGCSGFAGLGRGTAIIRNTTYNPASKKRKLEDKNPFRKPSHQLRRSGAVRSKNRLRSPATSTVGIAGPSTGAGGGS